MTPSTSVRIAAITLFLGISLGAFGAHALEDRLAETGRQDIWETATLYHLIHGVAMFAIALHGGSQRSVWIFLAGNFVFSGSLYALAITNISKFGAITFIGGLLFLTGWLYWIIKGLSSKKTNDS